MMGKAYFGNAENRRNPSLYDAAEKKYNEKLIFFYMRR